MPQRDLSLGAGWLAWRLAARKWVKTIASSLVARRRPGALTVQYSVSRHCRCCPRRVCVSSAQSDDVTVTSRRRRRISGSGRSATSVRSCRGGAAAAAAAGAAAPRAGGARATPTPRPARRATADRRAGPARASAGRARCSSRRRPSIVGRRRRRSAPTTTTASLTRATTSSTATTLSAQHRSVHTTARTSTGPTQKHSLPELSMGPFCVTRSNPTHQLTDPTQPTTSGKIWTQPDPTQYN